MEKIKVRKKNTNTRKRDCQCIAHREIARESRLILYFNKKILNENINNNNKDTTNKNTTTTTTAKLNENLIYLSK